MCASCGIVRLTGIHIDPLVQSRTSCHRCPYWHVAHQTRIPSYTGLYWYIASCANFDLTRVHNDTWRCSKSFPQHVAIWQVAHRTNVYVTYAHTARKDTLRNFIFLVYILTGGTLYRTSSYTWRSRHRAQLHENSFYSCTNWKVRNCRKCHCTPLHIETWHAAKVFIVQMSIISHGV